MHRICSYPFLAMLLLVPRTCDALQLLWSNGSSDLRFASAKRCTLVLRANPPEAALPPRWRLVWTTDSCEVRPLPASSGAACQLNLAEVSSVSGPADQAELEANALTARFCSAGGPAATTAHFVMDLAGGCKGKIKVVALDPTDEDSTRVTESTVATFNGGVADAFQPVILRASTVHRSTAYSFTAIGAGLAEASTLELVAHDGSWSHPLRIDSRDANSITASSLLAANVPPCVVKAVAGNGLVAPIALAGEPPPPLTPLPPLGSSCQETFREDIYPLGMIQPKDFAFVPGGWTPSGNWVFHLFYIRQNRETVSHHGGVPETEKNIGHAVSNNLYDWPTADIDTAAIAVRPGMFDSKHVWAPSILRRGITYYMFYTGVDDLGDQRRACHLDGPRNLGTAARPDFQLTELGGWATPQVPGPPHFNRAQFRDPFVMQDPDDPTNWIMYFVTISAESFPATIVGFARSEGDFSEWLGDQPLNRTQHPTGARAESPHVFARQGAWWLFYTAAEDDDPRVFATFNSASPTDLDENNWSVAQDINTLIIDEFTGLPTNSYVYWKRTELLEISAMNDVSYLAAYNDQAVGISYISLRTAESPLLFEERCPVTTTAVDDAPELVIDGPRLSLTGVTPAHVSVGLRVELPSAMHVHLAIYDVAGRQVRALASGMLPAGATDFKWGSLDDARTYGSGLYVAGLRAGAVWRSVRFPIVR